LELTLQNHGRQKWQTIEEKIKVVVNRVASRLRADKETVTSKRVVAKVEANRVANRAANRLRADKEIVASKQESAKVEANRAAAKAGRKRSSSV
jgi:hypothetical protein